MQQKKRIAVDIVLLMIATIALSVIFWNGCQKSNNSPIEQGAVDNSQQEQPVVSINDARVQAVIKVQNKYTQDIMANKAVVGTATCVNDDGTVVFKVFVKDMSYAKLKGHGIAASAIPAKIENVPVVVEETGEFKALAAHTAKQTPPIQLGTSGGWSYDLANGYCCGGTLGSLVQIGSTQYVLSNYHVLRADIVSGGNKRVATNGDPIIQPGLIDVNCKASGARSVATLAGSASLPSSNVDCAIAQVVPGMVRTDGSILEIGTISKSTVAAALRMKVKKSGRTSGLTSSTIDGLNATVSVTYDNECAGGTAFTKTFTGQILIKGGSFIKAGDSGSLMVEDKATNPRAVGLCFAGSNKYAVANPIDEVLSYLGATMVGK
ncbi:MAG: hypothetical protein ABSB78_01125 [Bacteroidota bacterium]